jgi:hypothetical protein
MRNCNFEIGSICKEHTKTINRNRIRQELPAGFENFHASKARFLGVTYSGVIIKYALTLQADNDV